MTSSFLASILIITFTVVFSNSAVSEDDATTEPFSSGQQQSTSNGLQSSLYPENSGMSEPFNDSIHEKKDLDHHDKVEYAWFEAFLPEFKKIITSMPIVGKSRVDDHGTLGRTIVHFLASQSDADLSLFHDLLKFGADINAADSYGQTPLHLAVIHNNLDLVRLLLEHGAVQCRNQEGSSPLHLALFLKNDDLASLLLQHELPIPTEESGDIYISDDNDALHIAIHMDTSESVFGQLLESGKGKNSLKEYHFGWKNVTVAFWRYSTFDSDDGTILPKAEPAGLVINNVGPLAHHAIFKCRQSLLHLLIAAGTDLGLTDRDKATTLHLAAEYCPDLVGTLISEEVPVNEQNNLDQTALHIAAKNGDPAVIKALIDAKASLVAKDMEDQTPIAYAEDAGHFQSSSLLKDAVAEQAALELVVSDVFEEKDTSDHPIVLQEQIMEVQEHAQTQTESEQPTSEGYRSRTCSSVVLILGIVASFTIL